MDERGIAPIIAIGVVALFALGVFFYANHTPKNTPRFESVQDFQPTDSQDLTKNRDPGTFSESSLSNDAAKLLAELRKVSGGMTPVRYKEIMSEIDTLESRGLEAQTLDTLRSMVLKFSVGGESEKPLPPPPPPLPPKQEAPRIETRPFWEFNPSTPEKGWYWARDGEPPACPESIVLPAPVDLNLVTAILYPGQIRGDGPKDFKPHGGFILKPEAKVGVEIRAPMDGYLTSVAKFTDEFGLHYGLGFVHPCGILWGGGHFGKLPSDVEAAIEKIPLKGFKESQTVQLVPPYFVKKGQVIVTGLQEKANPERPGFDWGIADYRAPNEASKNTAFRELYGSAPWNTYYGVCWLDWLPPEEEAVVRSFPGGDGKQGKNSEYCQ